MGWKVWMGILGMATTAWWMKGTCGQPAEPITVTLQPQVRFQTLLGWGGPAGLFWLPERLVDEIIEESVNGLGLTRLRFEPPRREWEDVFNDDGDPYHIHWASFKTARTDAFVAKVLLPFKRRVEANGEPFSLYVSPSFFDGGSSGSVPAWLLHSPAEYAEWATAMLLHLRNKHGIVADYYCICNEAGNNNPFTPQAVSPMIKVLGPSLKALGFPTRIQFPECVNANTSWNYIRAVQKDEEMWDFVGLVSYHLYGNNSERPNIRDFAWRKGLPTGQTEFMGLTIQHLYEDFTEGGVSFWEFYALNDFLRLNPSRTWFAHAPAFWEFRQVIRYVRPGAVRIEATSSDPSLRCLAFVKGGATTVVLLNTSPPAQARRVRLRGLPPGTYGLSWSAGGVYHEEGVRRMGDSGEDVLEVPPGAVATLYPHRGNLPPVMTDWRAEPPFLTQPAGRITLSASAVDPEGAPLVYRWRVLAQPPGASVALAAPGAPRTTATGLSVAGDYTFAITVSDGAGETTRRVMVTVYPDNQPPEIFDLHNRLPVTVTLPTTSTTLRGAGHDLEGDPLTYRWSILSQPAGAKALLASPDRPSCVASNLTVAGDYVFRFQVSDPTHTVARDLKVTVHPANAAPLIEALEAEPSVLRLPASILLLRARTKDPDGDVITHWWSVRSAPAGARPILERPGAPATVVKGLTVPGKYVFTLAAIDRAAVVRGEVEVFVQP